MKRLYLLLIIACCFLSSCAYPVYAPVLSFDYKTFTDKGIEVSPYDVPREGYILLGNQSKVYSTPLILAIEEVSIYSAKAMVNQDSIYIKYITERTIETATALGADAIFSFRTLPNVGIEEKNNIETKSYIVEYTLARKINPDGSYVNPNIKPLTFDKVEDIAKLEIDSTKCLAIEYDGYYKRYIQCDKQPSETLKNGYCQHHRYLAE